jgi:exodeoxyribonuclease X
MRIIFFDTETTGNTGDDRLCQLAIKERGVAEPIVNAIYKPPLPISIEAMSIHHITEKMVADQPSFQQAAEYDSLKSLFEDDETISVAHNATFDVGMLGREGIVPKNVICTYKVSSAMDPNDLIPSYRLQYLRYLLDLEVEGTAHDAFGDVVVLEALFERLLRKMSRQKGSEQEALTEMMAISALPMLFTTIRFGKHKGKRIEEVARLDPSYLEWLLTQKRQEPVQEVDWIYTLEHHLGR